MTVTALHADTVDVLGRWRPPTPHQEGLRDHYLARLAADSTATRRSCWPEHLTGSAVVLDPSLTRIAMVLHGKVNLWLQPGGHVEDGDARLIDTAVREAEEELGLSALEPLLRGPAVLDRHRAPCQPGEHDGFHLDVCYALVATGSTDLAVSEESHDVAWFDVDHLPEPGADDMRGRVDQVLSGIDGATRVDRLRRGMAHRLSFD